MLTGSRKIAHNLTDAPRFIVLHGADDERYNVTGEQLSKHHEANATPL